MRFSLPASRTYGLGSLCSPPGAASAQLRPPFPLLAGSECWSGRWSASPHDTGCRHMAETLPYRICISEKSAPNQPLTVPCPAARPPGANSLTASGDCRQGNSTRTQTATAAQGETRGWWFLPLAGIKDNPQRTQTVRTKYSGGGAQRWLRQRRTREILPLRYRIRP